MAVSVCLTIIWPIAYIHKDKLVHENNEGLPFIQEELFLKLQKQVYLYSLWEANPSNPWYIWNVFLCVGAVIT